jgi:arginase family enzyme
MGLEAYCEPVTLDVSNNLGVLSTNSYANTSLKAADVFLLGYSEDRNSDNIGVHNAPSVMREKLYSLHKTSKSLKILDLGNCKNGETVAQSYANLQSAVEILAKYDKPIIVFGGTQEASCYLAEASFKQVQFPSVCMIDARVDWEKNAEDFSNRNYISHLIAYNPQIRISQIGTQEYLSSREAFAWLTEHYFPMLRLGECNADIKQTESFIRDAQLVSFDINAIRYSDNPAGLNVNGFYAESACQCAWNAGYSPRMNIFFLSEFNPQKDTDSISAQLSAEILWHVLDGISQRKRESGDYSDDSYLKRYLKHAKFPQDICFYESLVSQTFWVEVPMKTMQKKRVIPCSLANYETFRNGFIPDFWMMEFQRLLSLS